MVRYKYIILIMVCLQFLFINKVVCQTNKVDKRDKLINQLNHFKELPDEIFEATLDSANIFVQKGDILVLSALFSLSFKSDGCVSESLGTLLGNIFLHKTNFFLNSLLTRNVEQQKHITAMAFYMDGGGMSPDDFNKIEFKLKELIKSKEIKMAKLANLCLSVLREVKKEINN